MLISAYTVKKHSLPPDQKSIAALRALWYQKKNTLKITQIKKRNRMFYWKETDEALQKKLDQILDELAILRRDIFNLSPDMDVRFNMLQNNIVHHLQKNKDKPSVPKKKKNG